MPQDKSSTDPINRYRAALRLAATVPYSLGMSLRRLAWKQTWLTHTVFSGRIKELQTLFAAIPPGPDIELALRKHLECNLAMSWRLQALSRCDNQAFNDWIQIDGMEHVERLISQKKGIVLANSHFGGGKTLLLALARMGFTVHSFDRRNIFSMFGIKEADRIHSIDLGDKNNSFLLKQVAKARNVLKSGGILHIAADGFRGQQGLQREFLGRTREFPTSFADLAIFSDAAVIPVFCPIDQHGVIHIKFDAPLRVDPELDHKTKVSLMIDQYTQMLAQRWRDDPGNVHENDLRIFGTLPYA